MAVTLGRCATHAYGWGLPVLAGAGERGLLSVWLQVHENENILAIFNKKKIQYQKLGVYRMLGPSGRAS